MQLGPLMADIAGTELSDEDRELLCHPAIGGVILFARNYVSVDQVTALCHAIGALRTPKLLITVDQEGGRVQRFVEGFTRLPAQRLLGERYDEDPHSALGLARQFGWLMASEVLACGVDFSFAPVLDIDAEDCPGIGDRALHAKPAVVAVLGNAIMHGMHAAGMRCVGKHFPGHGHVHVDSHLATPRDTRGRRTLWTQDLVPFRGLIRSGLDGILPGHIVYPEIDTQAACFSRVWLKRVLRDDFAFRGAIFSDDLSMGGAVHAGGAPQRIRRALDAGCDMTLLCNDRPAVAAVLDTWRRPIFAPAARRVERMRGNQAMTHAALRCSSTWHAARAALATNFVL